MNFTIGSDPELFLINQEGKFISAVGLIGGSKWEPQHITKDGHAILEDNVAVEFNIPPVTSASGFIKEISFVMNHLEERAAQLGLKFARNVASVSFDEDQLMTPEAQTFGCEPDFNAWTGKVNKKPSADDWKLRSCGGHVHVGTELDKCDVIRAMDLFLGVPSVLMDSDTMRRELYGKAGCFRPKSYGVEYRTLSNFWLWDNSLIAWVYQQTQKALEFVESGNTISDYHGAKIRRAINKGDLRAAESLVRAYN